jgi:hypothetical protein
MPAETPAAQEIARFLATRPTPEEIVAFHPSPEVAERAYDLIQSEREGTITDAERAELDTYMAIEYLMELIKVEAYRQLQQRAS